MIRDSSDLVAICRGAFEITPDDDNDLAQPARGLYVGGAGDVTVKYVDGSIVTLVELAAGVTHPDHVIRVYDTGTTATDIIGKK